MKECFKAVYREHRGVKEKYPVKQLSMENAQKVRRFYKSFPEYSVALLTRLFELVQELGVMAMDGENYWKIV